MLSPVHLSTTSILDTPSSHSTKKSKKPKTKHVTDLTSEAGPSTPKKSKRKSVLPTVAKKETNDLGDSPFLKIESKIRLSIAPVFGGDFEKGAREMLDSLIMRYSPSLSSVLLSYSHLQFLDPTSSALILNDNPFSIVECGFEGVVWKPEIGMKLVGTHSLSSPSHISLLLYKTFNISIPISHIPLEHYEFNPSLPSSKREFSPFSDEENDSDSERETEDGEEEMGRWVDKRTGKVVGDDHEGVQFTVVSLQISNQMISLTGSLLADPSNPREDVSAPVAPVTGDVEMAEPSVTAQKRKEKKEKRKSVFVTEQQAGAEAGINADAAQAEKDSLRREKKAAKRLAQQAATVAAGLAHDITDNQSEQKPTPQAASIPTGGPDDASGKKHKKRKAELGEAGGEHKKRKRDSAVL